MSTLSPNWDERRAGAKSLAERKDMRYYSTQRPVAPGSFPKPQGNRVEQIVNFPAKTYVDEIWKQAYGYIDYEKPLTEKEAAAYELTKGGDYHY